MNYTQFRLSNGDEIVAQVVEEPEGEDFNIVVRNALMVIRSENIQEGYRYYSFRPWMSFQLNDSYFQLLNFNHIVGEAKPDEVLLNQYRKALESEMNEPFNAKSDEEELEQIRRMVAKLKLVTDEFDSDQSGNVVHLFNKDKMH